VHTSNGTIEKWRHDHSFGQEQKQRGERRTFIVIALTAIFMVVEITAGLLFGSMALLADGLHMASHAAALSITLAAYVLARRLAHDSRFSFGSGKINALAGFTSAVLLAGFALLMAVESISRFFAPVPILFDQAIAVAVLGLLVNGISVVILGGHGQGEDHGHGHSHSHGHAHGRVDHNLRAAYLHVLADALTSLLAIIALLAGKYYGLVWMDPLMGIVGAILISRWSWGLLVQTSTILTDHQAPEPLRDRVRNIIESHKDTVVADLHVWSIGPSIYSGVIAIVSHEPEPPDFYKSLLPKDLGIVHVTIETHRCPD
jgi:cation diffusion facilitator family transporter